MMSPHTPGYLSDPPRLVIVRAPCSSVLSDVSVDTNQYIDHIYVTGDTLASSWLGFNSSGHGFSPQACGHRHLCAKQVHRLPKGGQEARKLLSAMNFVNV